MDSRDGDLGDGSWCEVTVAGDTFSRPRGLVRPGGLVPGRRGRGARSGAQVRYRQNGELGVVHLFVGDRSRMVDITDELLVRSILGCRVRVSVVRPVQPADQMGASLGGDPHESFRVFGGPEFAEQGG